MSQDEEFGSMMFADPEDVQADPIGELDVLQQVRHPLDWAVGYPRIGIRNGSGEA